MDDSLLRRWRKGREGQLAPEEHARLERDVDATFAEHEARVYQAPGHGSSFLRTTAA